MLLSNPSPSQHPSNLSSKWVVPIARWAVCVPSQHNPVPDVSFIDPMMRRRLGTLGKMSLKVAHDCAHDIPQPYLVYASRHGELTRTSTMLTDLAQGTPLSPTAFSLAVLNSSVGIYSICTQNHLTATAISSGTSSFGFGLLEASMQWMNQPDIPVLLIYADEPIPALYNSDQHISQDPPQAIGVLLHHNASTHLTCRITQKTGVPSEISQAHSFLDCLAQGESSWHSEEKTWTWQMQSHPHTHDSTS
ncbi:MAG: beta-ketoacyl synthase chain length factor [Ottowia sp.]|nr:beta-ketoacyl synthase chain length factor [Ottowia sp.]